MEDVLYFAHPPPVNNRTGPSMWGDHNMAAGLGEAASLCIDGVFVREYGAVVQQLPPPPPHSPLVPAPGRVLLHQWLLIFSLLRCGPV